MVWVPVHVHVHVGWALPSNEKRWWGDKLPNSSVHDCLIYKPELPTSTCTVRTHVCMCHPSSTSCFEWWAYPGLSCIICICSGPNMNPNDTCTCMWAQYVQALFRQEWHAQFAFRRSKVWSVWLVKWNIAIGFIISSGFIPLITFDWGFNWWFLFCRGGS